MKLVDCIILGKFMGLQTVEECVSNYYLHYLSTLPFSEAPVDQLELETQYRMYTESDLDIDWHYVQEQVDKQNKEYEKYMEDWQSGNAAVC